MPFDRELEVWRREIGRFEALVMEQGRGIDSEKR